jgi:hypothetical protein
LQKHIQLFTFDQNNPATYPENVRKTIVFWLLQSVSSKEHRVILSVYDKGSSTSLFISANGFVYYTGVRAVSVPYYSSLQNLDSKCYATLYQHTASS